MPSLKFVLRKENKTDKMEELHMFKYLTERKKTEVGIFYHFSQLSPIGIYDKVSTVQHIHYKTEKGVKQ